MNGNPQNGITHIALILVVTVLGGVGLVGWQVQSRNAKLAKPSSTATAAPVKASNITETVPSSLTTKANVRSAINVTDDPSIDKDLDSSSLNDDINKLN